MKQGVAITGRNRTGPPCSTAARPPTRPAAEGRAKHASFSVTYKYKGKIM